jgi:hypothetical protein
VKTCGLSQPSALPIHRKFSISFFENISYGLFDKRKNNKHRFGNFVTKILTKI